MFGPNPIPIYGLYYYYQHRVVSLPLLNVRAEAGVKELAAQVKLTQTYANDAAFPIEAKYSFPIPARAAVCTFIMIKQDGTRVVGSVQEKQEAGETYNAAVAQGQQASLMEQKTPDVFEVSVGNIPSNEQVQIELVYATELSEDEEGDSIRFHLPVHIGARYGQAPQSAHSVFRSTVFISSSSKAPFLSIAANVEAIVPISKIGSPSHTVSTELGPDPKLPNFKDLPFSNYARISLSSDSALDKDFVLTIKSAGLDTPRCVAELHPTHDTVALGLTLVPRFKLPDLSRQEFVFLVDRSGSMGGNRIAAARKALVVMLRALPHQDSLFQIMSFGSWCSALWPTGSKSYNQETLEEATRHVDAMQADYGGTEIRAALQQCFKARKWDRPMSVLVLTDGDAWDLDGVFNEIKSAVAAAPKTAYVRVSVLGIGNSASTAMCEGIARLGNGTCMMVGEEETSFTGKIARMLKAARSPPISDITVDWGRPPVKGKTAAPPGDDEFEIVEKASEKKKLNIFDQGIDDPMETDDTPTPPPPAVVLPPPAAVQQAPFVIRNLFPNIRLNAYAILQGKTIPKTVIIRGSTADGAEIELPIPITFSHLQNAPGAPPAIHALAARKIIQDLEDGQHALAATLANPDDTDLLARTVKASIIRLGKTYSISSSHTSFVAVDESKPKAPAASEVYVIPAPPEPSIFGAHYAMQPMQPMVGMSPSTGMGGGLFGTATPAPRLQGNSSSFVPRPLIYYGAAAPSASSAFGSSARPQQQQYTPSMQQGASSSDLMSFGSPATSAFSRPMPAFGSAAPGSSPYLNSSYGGFATADSYSGGEIQEAGFVGFGQASPSSAAPPPQATSQGLFGGSAASGSGLFGQTPSLLGAAPHVQATSQGLSGGSSTPVGGGGLSGQAFSLFGAAPPLQATSQSVFGGSSTPTGGGGLFGQGPPNPNLFGAAPRPPQGLFGGSGTPAFGSGLFGQAPPNPSPFGSAAQQSTFGGFGTPQQAASASDPLEALARLQSFDGCFSLEVLNIIKLSTDLQNVRSALPAGAPDAVVATVLAMAFLATKLGASMDRDSWEGLHQKAEQYVEAALRSMGAVETADMLQEKVAEMLA
ncbi:von Willebrand factor type A domain-containing protein [Mycena rosella]|uniref:von Willebrand factor type A domain-containing protein n=1 Tax=Mycena rosella TaxID=1033263 RepID=A0AAD7DBW1_MYCRO|nr:von Willebrand factor type A domain-containing protein [Mycena rosella]